jgi:hypothetical protein
MAQHKIDANTASDVSIENAIGNLQIKGWDRSEILFKTNADDTPGPEQKNGSIQILCKGDCILRVPHDINLRIGSVQGNTQIKLVEGSLHIDRIQGSLALRNVGSTQATVIQGDLLARQVVGDLHIDQVVGNCVVRDVEGDCTIDQVHGNLELRDAENNIDINASGNARVRLCMLIGESYKIEAGGNLTCQVPEDASLKVDMESRSKEITFQIPNDQRKIKEEIYSLSLGGTEASMSLVAGGKIFFATQESEWAKMDDVQAELEGAFSGISEEFAHQMTDQIEAQIESQLDLLDEHLDGLSESLTAAGISEAEIDRIVRRAQEESEQASARAQEKMRRAHEKMERKLAAAQRKAELKARAAERHSQTQRQRTWSYERSSSSASTSSRPVEDPISDDERLMILRMLEQKKISLQEAEQLLAALEGS